MIDQLFAKIRSTGTTDVKVEFLNLPSYVKPRFEEFLKDQPEDIQAVYAHSQEAEYREKLEPVIRDALNRHKLKMRFNEIVYHASKQKLNED